MRWRMLVGLVAIGCGDAPVARRPAPPPAAAHAPRPDRAVVGPDPMDVLAASPIAGRAAIAGRQRLFATAAAAQTVAGQPLVGVDDAVSVRVVADRGDVIAVRTDADAADCLGGAIDGYELDVYVPRSALLPRVARPVQRRFDDDSGYVIDRGAPLRVRRRALEAIEPLLADLAAPVALADAALAIDPEPPTLLPSPGGASLVCDPLPVDHATWNAERERRRDEERAKQAAREKRECYERTAAERAKPRRRKNKRDKSGIEDILAESFDPATLCERMGSVLGNDSADVFGDLGVSPPACRFTAGGALLVGGTPLGQVARTTAESTDGALPFERVGHRVLVTIPARCAQVRAIVPPDHELRQRGGGAGIGQIGPGGRERYWVPRTGSHVTWPDGTPAGRYVSGHRHLYHASVMTEEQGRLCAPIARVDTRVCFDRADLVEQVGY